jgi:ubiquinone/menaquinone biosynthesis C-methylase UbiE
MDIEESAKFWDDHPVDGFLWDAKARLEFRKKKDRWITVFPDSLQEGERMLSVGCGQGTDVFAALERMKRDAKIVGIDISSNSLKSAADEIGRTDLNNNATFIHADVQKLPFENESFDTVWSLGVLHHVPDIKAALSEIKRVLRPEGKLFLMLYRSSCPKGILVNIARRVSRFIDIVMRQNHYLYNKIRKTNGENKSGTAIYELLGCPILNLYSGKQVHALLRNFSNIKMESYESGIYGLNVFLPEKLKRFLLPILNSFDPSKSFLGFHWLITAKKGS